VEPAFFADAMLGGLTRWLRVLGVDTAYDPALDDPELVARAVAEDRVILTRDVKLLERRAASNHLLVASHRLDEQVRQVIEVFEIPTRPERLFSRCLRCNVPLEPMATEEAHRLVPPFVARTQTRFRRCPGCERIFWASSHVRRMRQRLGEMGIPVE
jgi:uncharacterized protein with PIN domain